MEHEETKKGRIINEEKLRIFVSSCLVKKMID